MHEGQLDFHYRKHSGEIVTQSKFLEVYFDQMLVKQDLNLFHDHLTKVAKHTITNILMQLLQKDAAQPDRAT